MLTKKEISEIRDHLEKAQNPVFFYDNDADGLCSYILLRKFLGRGKGVAIRTHPGLDVGYAKKAQELNADYIFVLDRPYLGKEFVEEIEKFKLPIVWIDHHETDEKHDYENLYIYNPNNSNKKSNEPITYWSYKITNKKEDIWLAIMGCIADHFLPDFSKEFSDRFPDFWGKVEKPFDAYYKTEIGFLARSLGYGLKDSITHVVQLQNLLISCKIPNDLFLELELNSAFGKKFREIRKKYGLLLEKAEKVVEEKLVFFKYGGDLSISADLSNELSYKYPNHYIVVAFNSGNLTNLSMRGDNVRDILNKLSSKFENFSGGGHRDAVGARLLTEDLERLKKGIEEEIK
jgi:single-stranded DNA-specific DHH superfamily exonuclease